MLLIFQNIDYRNPAVAYILDIIYFFSSDLRVCPFLSYHRVEGHAVA
jgi:hypothetical protein